MAAGSRLGRRRLGHHPARLLSIAFGLIVVVGTVLLLLPVSTRAGADTDLMDALFTATSAVTVTGLAITDTAEQWTTFGQIVILVLVQLGGFGIMTLSSLVVLLFSRRLGLRHRMLTQAETNTLNPGDVRRVVKGVALVSLVVEAVAAIVLTWRFAVDEDISLGRAAYQGVFHAVSAFNNAGFSLFDDSLVGFVGDWWICLTVGLAVIAGGLGFPVWTELRASLTRPAHWSLHTKLTLATTLALIVVGTVLITASEWTNPGTLGDLPVSDRLLAGWFQSVSPRSSGFNTIDYSAMRETSLLSTDVLMYIGGGSASTAGGIKVTTFGLLGFVAWSELRGEPDVNLYRRRVPAASQRQAITLVLISLGVVITGTFAIMVMADVGLSQALFEVVSAFSTAGLSTGLTAQLGGAAQALIMVLMFFGRVGPITLFAALMIRESDRLYRFPQERPIIG